MPELSPIFVRSIDETQDEIGSLIGSAWIISDVPIPDDPENTSTERDCGGNKEAAKTNTIDESGAVEYAAKLAALEARAVKAEARIAELEVKATEEVAKINTMAAARIAELEAKAAESSRLADKHKAQADKYKVKLEEAKADKKSIQKELDRTKKENEKLKSKFGGPKLDSGNSSVPPSKNGLGGKKVKGSKDKTGDGSKDGEKPEKKKPGAKKGHEGHARRKGTPDEIVEFQPESTTCDCGAEMAPAPGKNVHAKQIEIPDTPAITFEYVGQAYQCPKCGKIHRGAIPERISLQGLVGPNLAALIVSLKLNGMSYRSIRKPLIDTHKVTLSIGFLTKVFLDYSEAIKAPFQEIEEKVKGEPVLYIDETPHLNSGAQLYNWVFVAAGIAVLYSIGNRSRDIINGALGADWMGTICCDYYAVYISYAKDTAGVALQHCLAHLKRDFKYCSEHLHPDMSRYGDKMLDILAKLFAAWREYKAARSLKNFSS